MKAGELLKKAPETFTPEEIKILQEEAKEVRIFLNSHNIHADVFRSMSAALYTMMSAQERHIRAEENW